MSRWSADALPPSSWLGAWEIGTPGRDERDEHPASKLVESEMSNEVQIPKGLITAAMRREVNKALLEEARSVLSNRGARVSLCLALGAIKTALEDAEIRGGFKAYVEQHLRGRMLYSEAHKYAVAGQAPDPEAAFRELELKDAKQKARPRFRRGTLATRWSPTTR